MERIVVKAPTALNAESRAAFYDAALAALQRLDAAAAGELVVDMRATDRVDSSGLATLVLIQVRAAERKRTVGLLGLSEEIRFLLVMTRLEDRFNLDPQL